MSEVDALERDVEAARARLVNRVAQLKAPPISGVKDELVADATEYKDEVIDSAKQKVTDAIDGFVSDVKRRAADNPVAVAAIGAGLAWRLWQKPPIATLLVGAGVAALFGRSSVHEIDIDPYDPDRPSGYVPGGVAGYGYGTTRGTIEQKVIGGATVAAETAREKVSELRAKANELKDSAFRSAGELTDRARESAAELRDNAVRSASELMGSARHSADQLRNETVRSSGAAVDTLSSYARDARSRIQPAREYAEDVVRDNGVYLGLAALAVGAAAGIGFMQMNKPPPQDDAYLEGEDIRVE
jgi:F0F1-type ATP synthase membrane subunit b/b'